MKNIGAPINRVLSRFGLKVVQQRKAINESFELTEHLLRTRCSTDTAERLIIQCPKYFRSVISQVLLEHGGFNRQESLLRNILLSESEYSLVRAEILDCLNGIQAAELKSFSDGLRKKVEDFPQQMRTRYQREIAYASQLGLPDKSSLTMWEIASGQGMLSVIAEILGHTAFCSDIGCDKGLYYPGCVVDEWLRIHGYGLKMSCWFQYNPAMVKTLLLFQVRGQFDIVAFNGLHEFPYQLGSTDTDRQQDEDNFVADQVLNLLALIRPGGILQIRHNGIFREFEDDAYRSGRIAHIAEQVSAIDKCDVIQVGMEPVPVTKWNRQDMSLVLQKVG